MFGFLKRKFRKKIARIEITGAIGASTRTRVLEALEFVEENKFPALLLRIDSPGGTVGDSQEIYIALKRLRERANIKVVASFGNISASGGVYIGVGADYIVSNPGTITGSIGVILRGNNIEKLLDKIGISFKVIKSGAYKDILSFDRDITEEEREILQSLIDSSYLQFVETVAEGRKLSPATVRSFADGRVFTGEQALSLGLVDRLGTEEDARVWVSELAGLDPKNTKVFTIKPPKTFASKFLPNGSESAIARLQFETETSGMPLWMWQ
ncbi:MAG: signal peptide peptidase SppA [Pseudanabaena sp.]|jgi:protease-4|nr:signal peptide peptidase SppA [Pseudanabaena sp. M135S2SP2A07QC]MCA6572427.1 signal peptide peptidase SppA [Pseudanabaena sp. M53BS1SP1A06MG]MCA6583025.1 signal peptide peptidase SppA [Pseudanabaena sp. M34BS1SP1A06MG]MCA6587213.1 signal peptide peptidase SppA [Pseudanabaena sp. M051S1SP1A06QC]MCA6589582.1 signal peptide peptidase SppA [Pseudanabaena sp. M109S1SP1A06QC]MCA6591706.1 signal peptide peptidase SppA [Pseudanabaena sp. M38BS1SP1A06MG]MCA6595158.1 signal peptide peptidase SppA [P